MSIKILPASNYSTILELLKITFGIPDMTTESFIAEDPNKIVYIMTDGSFAVVSSIVPGPSNKKVFNLEDTVNVTYLVSNSKGNGLKLLQHILKTHKKHIVLRALNNAVERYYVSLGFRQMSDHRYLIMVNTTLPVLDLTMVIKPTFFIVDNKKTASVVNKEIKNNLYDAYAYIWETVMDDNFDNIVHYITIDSKTNNLHVFPTDVILAPPNALSNSKIVFKDCYGKTTKPLVYVSYGTDNKNADLYVGSSNGDVSDWLVNKKQIQTVARAIQSKLIDMFL